MKRIGIFTKFGMAGGSEFRALEMAAAVSRVRGYQGVLLAEGGIAENLRPSVSKNLEVHEGIFSTPNLKPLYSVDYLLVINTDSKDFTTLDYWMGRSRRHAYEVDLSRIRRMSFLFNFLVSPSIQLGALQACVPDIRIITANGKFFNEISEQPRYLGVRHFPRLQLDSPIDPAVAAPKTKSKRLRFGMHSLPLGDKWNSELPLLIAALNETHGDKIAWDFLGMPRDLAKKVAGGNVTVRKEFSKPVREFLRGIDVFVFFSSWKREEAWARSAGEALMSGCPMIATARGGNKNQVIHRNTGFLCKSLEAFAESCEMLIENPELFRAMQGNVRREAKRFKSGAVARRFLEFIK